MLDLSGHLDLPASWSNVLRYSACIVRPTPPLLFGSGVATGARERKSVKIKIPVRGTAVAYDTEAAQRVLTKPKHDMSQSRAPCKWSTACGSRRPVKERTLFAPLQRAYMHIDRAAATTWVGCSPPSSRCSFRECTSENIRRGRKRRNHRRARQVAAALIRVTTLGTTRKRQ